MSTVAHPWATPAGAENAGITAASIRGDGAVRWSVDLPMRTAWNLVAARDGRWAAGGHLIIAGGDRDRVAWRRDEPSSPPALLDDDAGLLAVARGVQGLACLDLADGRERWTRDGVHAVCAPISGHALAAVEVSGRDCSLVFVEHGGVARWSHPVGHPIGVPLAWRDVVVHAARNRIDAFSASGEPLWHASPAGFNVPAQSSDHVFTTPPFALDDRRMAIGVNAFEWRGFLVVDPTARVAAPWRLPNGTLVIDEKPVAVRRVAGLPLAMVTRHMFHLCVTAIDGSHVIQAELPSAPYGYAVDPAGRIAVAYSLDLNYHDRYLWHDEGRALQGRSGIALFDPDLRRRWVWDAPGPLGGFAVSVDGEILVTSEGRLWAIG